MNTDTIEQIKDLLTANVPFNLIGVPGIGKTSEVEQLIQSQNGHLETVIASGMEPSDFGIPVRLDDKTVGFALPAWAARCIEAAQEGKLTLLLIDEASQVHPAMQAPMLELIRDGRINGDWKLPKTVRRACIMNPPECGGQWDISAPMANRMAHINVSPDLESWSHWMIKQEDPHNVRSMFVAFLKARPALMCQVPKEAIGQSGPYPTLRTWDMASRVRTDQARASLVGSPAYAEFIQWRNAADLPNPEDVLKGKAKLPERPDARYATLIAISSLASRDYKQWGKEAWKIIIKVADSALDEALVPARALAMAAPNVPSELGKLAPALARITK